MAIFGYDGTGASTTAATQADSIANTHSSTRLTAGPTDTIVSYSARLGTGSTQTTMGFSAYTFTGSDPVTRAFTQTDATGITSAAGLYSTGAVSQALTPGTNYTVATTKAGRIGYRFDTIGAGERVTTGATPLPATWTTSTTGTTRYMMFATYTTGGANDLSVSIASTFSLSIALTGNGQITVSPSSAFTLSITLTGLGGSDLNPNINSGFTPSITLSGGITIFDNYPRSSVNVPLSSVTGTGDSAIIRLKPRYGENETIGVRWMEISAGIDGVAGIRPFFEVLDYASGLVNGYSWPGTRRMMFSEDDGLTWQYFATTTFVGGSHIAFRHNVPFTSNRIRVSRSRQVSVGQFGQFIADLAAAHPTIISPPASAVAFTPTAASAGFPAQDYIVNEFSTQTDELGRTVPQVPFYGFVINDTSLMPPSGTKTTIYFDSGMHAGEDYGDWVMMECIKELFTSSSFAQFCRRYFKFRIYGFSNGPGRDGGNYRSGFTQGTGGTIDDGNRHFSDANPGLESVTIPRTAYLADRNSEIVSALFAWHGSYLNNYATFEDNAIEAAFANLLRLYTGFTIVDEGTSNSGSVGYWGANTLGAALSTTMEFGDLVPQSDANIQTYAEGWVRALSEIFQTVLTTNITSTFTASITLTGAGAVAPNVTSGFTPAITATGTGQVAAAPTSAFTTSVTLQGAAPISVSMASAFTMAVTLTGTGHMIPSIASEFSESISLSDANSGVFTATLSSAFTTAVALTGVGGMTPALTSAFVMSAALTATSGMTPNVVTGFTPAISLTGTGALVTDIDSEFSEDIDLSFPGSGDISTSITQAFVANISLTSSSIAQFVKYTYNVPARNNTTTSTQASSMATPFPKVALGETWYSVDWRESGYLLDDQDITASEWTIEPVLVESPVSLEMMDSIFDTDKTLIKLKGGSANNVYKVRNKITVSGTGEIDARTIYIAVSDNLPEYTPP